MVQKVKRSFLKTIEEEFIRTTDTLWENEVQANLFVARVMLGTAVIDIVFILLGLLHVVDISSNEVLGILLQSFLELVIPAALCLYLKGQKKWLKILLLIEYTIVLARVESVLTHNVTLCMVFPVVLSIRYYSRPVTSFIAFFTVLLSGFADYAAIMWKLGRIDMNMLRLPAGTVLKFDELVRIRQVVMEQATVDYNDLWMQTLRHSYVPKLILYSMIAIMCSEIAKRGRAAIFDQQSETQKTERISTELNLASSIQANMLPNIFPAFPERFEFDIYATMTPAKEVGGDFYDFFMVDEDHLAMVMADVSGKGIPAAMFMVIAKTLIKDHTQLGLYPADVFTRVNNLLCEGNEAGLFVTAWMGVLDLNNGELIYANAGHNPPVIKQNGEIKYLHCKPGFVLAGMEDYQYKEYSLMLSKGDKLFLYTDGATEATNINKELYGEERLLNCLKSLGPNMNCADALHAVRADIDKFVGEAEQFDDLTLLAFDFTPKSKEKETIERTFDATDEKLHDVLAFVEEGLESHEASMKATMAITVALEEMFVNIAHYAYPDKPGKATIGMHFNDDEVELHLIDNGIPFNPLAKEDPDITLQAEDRQIGGLGIYMVKQSMDHCEYYRRSNENHFIMRRKIK